MTCRRRRRNAQRRSRHAIALASQSSTPMAAALCRPYLPRLASVLTVTQGWTCIAHVGAADACRGLSPGWLPATALGRGARNWVRTRPERLVTSLAMLPLKRVRPTGASRRLRPTEYPTFFTKIETQAPTFPNANPWARCGIWASAINTATVRSQRSSRDGRDSGDRPCLLSDRGAGLPTVDCPRAARGARPRARSRALMPPEPRLICRTGLMRRARHNEHSATSLHEFWDEHLDRT